MADKKQELTGELEAARGELERLKQAKETITRELESRDTAIAELKQAAANQDSEVVALKQFIVESDEKLVGVNNTLAQAVASYKNLAVESNPGVLAELVTGDTIDAVNESLEKARILVDKVRQEVVEEASRAKVPAGAPQRTPIDLSVLSPREKIQYAIGGKG